MSHSIILVKGWEIKGKRGGGGGVGLVERDILTVGVAAGQGTCRYM